MLASKPAVSRERARLVAPELAGSCAVGHQLQLTQENVNILGYFLGLLQTSYQITDTRDNGATVIMIVVVLDYFLGVGHTYDQQATIDTVANCRLFYVCAGSIALAFLYAFSSSGTP